jgi:hypothetical protein
MLFSLGGRRLFDYRIDPVDIALLRNPAASHSSKARQQTLARKAHAAHGTAFLLGELDHAKGGRNLARAYIQMVAHDVQEWIVFRKGLSAVDCVSISSGFVLRYKDDRTGVRSGALRVGVFVSWKDDYSNVFDPGCERLLNEYPQQGFFISIPVN